MPLTVVLVGTRKGCFILESDADRRDWKMRGPYCEGWPIYHAVHDADSGAIYAAAASEWFRTQLVSVLQPATRSLRSSHPEQR